MANLMVLFNFTPDRP